MLLATPHVLRPVTGVCLFVVEKAADAKLFSGGAVPASPVAGAGRLVSKNSVEPVAVISADGWICKYQIR